MWTEFKNNWQRGGQTHHPCLASGVALWCVIFLLPAGLPESLTCCTCFTLWPRGPVLLAQFQHESVFEAQRTKTQTLAICFMCSRLNHQLSSSSSSSSTGRYIHICCSDLRHYYFIVWHTICIELQFSVLKGLPWFKTVSNVQGYLLHPQRVSDPTVLGCISSASI